MTAPAVIFLNIPKWSKLFAQFHYENIAFNQLFSENMKNICKKHFFPLYFFLRMVYNVRCRIVGKGSLLVNINNYFYEVKHGE